MPSMVAKSCTGFGWGKGRIVMDAGRHVISHSSEVLSRTAISVPLPLPFPLPAALCHVMFC